MHVTWQLIIYIFKEKYWTIIQWNKTSFSSACDTIAASWRSKQSFKKYTLKRESAVLSSLAHLWAACLWEPTLVPCKELMRQKRLAFYNCGSNESGIIRLQWNFPCNGISIINSKFEYLCHQNPNVSIVFRHLHCPHIPRFRSLIILSGDDGLGILICVIWQIIVIVPIYRS